jgi:transcriptional regulator with XRE-family HTH domain
LSFLGFVPYRGTDKVTFIMSTVKGSLANKLRELRSETPLNQVQKATGIIRTLLRCYELGEKVIGDENLKILSQYYDVPFAELKKLQFEDQYPVGTETRELLFQWVRESLKPE